MENLHMILFLIRFNFPEQVFSTRTGIYYISKSFYSSSFPSSAMA